MVSVQIGFVVIAVFVVLVVVGLVVLRVPVFVLFFDSFSFEFDDDFSSSSRLPLLVFSSLFMSLCKSLLVLVLLLVSFSLLVFEFERIDVWAIMASFDVIVSHVGSCLILFSF